MEPEGDKFKQELKTFVWKAVPGAPAIYTNYFHLGWTLDDLRITLGALKGVDVSTTEHYAEEQGSVIMPYRQAKNLRDALTRLLTAYEEKNGEIGTPYLAVVGDQGKQTE